MSWRGIPERRKGEGLVFVLVILAILCGIVWYLYNSRRNTEKEGWAYAREVADHIVLQKDTRYVDQNIAAQAQVGMPPSFRERIFNKLNELGAPDRNIKLQGHLNFSSYFFEPRGYFRAEVAFPSGPAYLDMTISPSHGPWQIEGLNLTWDPHSKF
jgi:hypothetical protein